GHRPPLQATFRKNGRSGYEKATGSEGACDRRIWPRGRSALTEPSGMGARFFGRKLPQNDTGRVPVRIGFSPISPVFLAFSASWRFTPSAVHPYLRLPAPAARHTMNRGAYVD